MQHCVFSYRGIDLWCLVRLSINIMGLSLHCQIHAVRLEILLSCDVVILPSCVFQLTNDSNTSLKNEIDRLLVLVQLILNLVLENKHRSNKNVELQALQFF